jgi:hypothetical protein
MGWVAHRPPHGHGGDRRATLWLEGGHTGHLVALWPPSNLARVAHQPPLVDLEWLVSHPMGGPALRPKSKTGLT